MYFRQPDYFSSFKCIGGTCRFSCCVGWNIAWSDDEVNKVKSAPNCPETIKSLMENSFETTDNARKSNRVILKEGGRCPMLTEENLCILQKELGEDYLCDTCYEFPRRYRMVFDVHSKHFSHIYRGCNLSCPEVSKRLTTDKKAMNLVNIPVKDNARMNAVKRDSNETFKAHPEYFYRIDLFELFYGLISDRKVPVETAVIRGAFIADMFSKVVADKQQSVIPQLMSQLKSQLNNLPIYKQIDQIAPNPEVKLGILSSIMDEFAPNNTLGMLRTENGEISTELYANGEKNLADTFGDDFWLRNFALNLLLELSVPFYSEKFSILENYAYFLTAFACIKLNAIASMSQGDREIDMQLRQGYSVSFSGKESVWGFTSVISRELCQNHENAPKLIEALKQSNLINPAALALLLK